MAATSSTIPTTPNARTRKGTRTFGGICLSLLLAIAQTPNSSLAAVQEPIHIGLNFLDVPIVLPELPQARFVEGEWVVDSQYHPVAITDPASLVVTEGALAGWTEAAVREAVRFEVETIYRAVVPGLPSQTLNINFYNGTVPTSQSGRRLNVVIGSNDLEHTLYGWSQINAVFNTSTYPNDSHVAAVFVDNLDTLSNEPDVDFTTPEAALNNLAGTIAHEIGHLFGLGHEAPGTEEPYAVMAIGPTGLTGPMRLTARRFHAASQSNLALVVGVGERADFNMDGDVDIFQLDGGGDAQILVANLGRATGASLMQGDANTDGDVDVFQPDGQGDAQILVASLGADVEPGSAIASYDPVTGSIRLEIGPGIGVAGFATDGLFTRPETHSVSWSGPEAPAQFDADVLALFNASGLTAGIYDFAQVLPVGLTASDLRFSFTPLGSETIVGQVVVIPEPAAWLLSALGMLIVAIRRHAAPLR